MAQETNALNDWIDIADEKQTKKSSCNQCGHNTCRCWLKVNNTWTDHFININPATYGSIDDSKKTQKAAK